MKPLSYISLVLFFLAAGFTRTNAQTNDRTGHLSANDYAFARAALAGGKMEITLGQIAATNAQDAGVRQFAATMVRDHQAANQELVQIITQQGAAISDAPDKRMITKFQGLTGPDFDKAYMKQMVSDHKEVVKAFQTEADNGDSPDLKNFASNILPVLRQHFTMAKGTQARLNSSAAN